MRCPRSKFCLTKLLLLLSILNLCIRDYLDRKQLNGPTSYSVKKNDKKLTSCVLNQLSQILETANRNTPGSSTNKENVPVKRKADPQVSQGRDFGRRDTSILATNKYVSRISYSWLTGGCNIDEMIQIVRRRRSLCLLRITRQARQPCPPRVRFEQRPLIN